MESRVMGNCHARFGAGENLEESDMQPAAAYPAQKITYRYLGLWLRQQWNHGGSDFAINRCL